MDDGNEDGGGGGGRIGRWVLGWMFEPREAGLKE